MAHHDDHPGENDDSPSPTTYFQVPPTAPPQLPPETYTYLIQALLSLQHSSSQSQPYYWPSPSVPDPSSSHSLPFPPHAEPQSAGSSQPTPSSAIFPAVPPLSQEPEPLEDGTSITEDKRRRNTAASARFRVKKKLKTLNLERTVSDLTGRTEELEREATDLRRENAWLKEIVLLKGRHLAALNFTSQDPSSSNRRNDDSDGKDEPEHESTVNHRDKGKRRQS